MRIIRSLLILTAYFQIINLSAMEESNDPTFEVGKRYSIDSINILKEWLPSLKDRPIQFISDVDETITIPSTLLYNAEQVRDFDQHFKSVYQSLDIPQEHYETISSLIDYARKYGREVLKDDYYRITEEGWKDFYKQCTSNSLLDFRFLSGRKDPSRDKFLSKQLGEVRIDVTLGSKGEQIIKELPQSFKQTLDQKPIVIFLDNNLQTVKGVRKRINSLKTIDGYYFHYAHTKNYIDSKIGLLKYQLVSLLHGTTAYNDLLEKKEDWLLKVKLNPNVTNKELQQSIMDKAVNEEGMNLMNKKIEEMKLAKTEVMGSELGESMILILEDDN